MKSVAAVCDNEVLIFGELNEKTGVRPLMRIERFYNYGQALSYARDHDDKQKEREKKR